MRFYESEEAVSPVIGVILMVAITVILAAVIAVFVFGMAGDVEGTKSVGATAKQVDTNITVTYHGGPDHDSIANITVTIYPEGSSTATAETPDSWVSTNVGTMVSYSGGSTAQERVVVVAQFDDGYEQVILDQTV